MQADRIQVERGNATVQLDLGGQGSYIADRTATEQHAGCQRQREMSKPTHEQGEHRSQR